MQRAQLIGVLASAAVGAGLAAVGGVAFLIARQLVFVGHALPSLPSFAAEHPTPIWLAALGGAAICALATGRPWGGARIVRAAAAALCVVAAATAVVALVLPTWRSLPTGRWVDVGGGLAVALAAGWLAIRKGDRVLMSARHGLAAAALTALTMAPSVVRTVEDLRAPGLAPVVRSRISSGPVLAGERLDDPAAVAPRMTR